MRFPVHEWHDAQIILGRRREGIERKYADSICLDDNSLFIPFYRVIATF